jgi:hypothetical protein
MKTAIFLRGHARTWNLIKNDIITMFSNLYDDIDWYIGIWDTETVSDESIKNDFKGKNIKFIDTKISEKKYKSDFKTVYNDLNYPVLFNKLNFYKTAYLDLLLSQKKREFEITENFEYESTIFIRPDVLYSLVVNRTKENANIPLNAMEIVDIFLTFWYWNDNSWKGSDLFMRAGKIASNLFCTRFFDTDCTDGVNFLLNNCPHNLSAKFLLKNELTVKDASLFDSTIIRPDFLKIKNEINSDDHFDRIHKYNNNWAKLKKENNSSMMVDYCIENNIDPRDYQLYINLIFSF